MKPPDNYLDARGRLKDVIRLIEDGEPLCCFLRDWLLAGLRAGLNDKSIDDALGIRKPRGWQKVANAQRDQLVCLYVERALWSGAKFHAEEGGAYRVAAEELRQIDIKLDAVRVRQIWLDSQRE